MGRKIRDTLGLGPRRPGSRKVTGRHTGRGSTAAGPNVARDHPKRFATLPSRGEGIPAHDSRMASAWHPRHFYLSVFVHVWVDEWVLRLRVYLLAHPIPRLSARLLVWVLGLSLCARVPPGVCACVHVGMVWRVISSFAILTGVQGCMHFETAKCT